MPGFFHQVVAVALSLFSLTFAPLAVPNVPNLADVSSFLSAGAGKIESATGVAGKEFILKSFGGRIVSINYCINGAINVLILPAGAFPISYVWTPATLTFPPWQPPNHIGQEVLGLATLAPIPFVGFGTHPPIWFGLGMVTVGTSPL